MKKENEIEFIGNYGEEDNWGRDYLIAFLVSPFLVAIIWVLIVMIKLI